MLLNEYSRSLNTKEARTQIGVELVDSAKNYIDAKVDNLIGRNTDHDVETSFLSKSVLRLTEQFGVSNPAILEAIQGYAQLEGEVIAQALIMREVDGDNLTDFIINYREHRVAIDNLNTYLTSENVSPALPFIIKQAFSAIDIDKDELDKKTLAFLKSSQLSYRDAVLIEDILDNCVKPCEKKPTTYL